MTGEHEAGNPPAGELTAPQQAVVSILAKHLAAARRGEYVAIGLVAVAGQAAATTDHGGAIGTEFAMNFGIDVLKNQVMTEALMRMSQKKSSIIHPAAAANRQ